MSSIGSDERDSSDRGQPSGIENEVKCDIAVEACLDSRYRWPLEAKTRTRTQHSSHKTGSKSGLIHELKAFCLIK